MKRLFTYFIIGALSTAYARFLETEKGEVFIDEYTTVGMVLGVGGVLAALRLTQPREEWRRTTGAFVAAGLPMVVRGVIRKIGG